MVYKKFIKRGGKIFGPYYYESYRDKKGNVKTRYVDTEDKQKKDLDKKSLLITIVILVSIIFAFSVFVINLNLTGHVSLDLKENYKLNQNLTGKLTLQIEKEDYIQKDKEIVLTLKKGDNVLIEKKFDFEEFLIDLQPVEIINITENCTQLENETLCENITTSNYYFNQTGYYERDLQDFITYTFTGSGDYSLNFSIPSLNKELIKDFYVASLLDENRTQEDNFSVPDFSILSVPGEINTCQKDINVSGTYTLNTNLINDSLCMYNVEVNDTILDGAGHSITMSSGLVLNIIVNIAFVDRNQIYNFTLINSGAGIYLSSSNSIIRDNYLLNQSVVGIGIYGGQNNILTNNYINQSGTYGLQILTNSNNISGGHIDNANQDAIVIGGANNLLNNITITNTNPAYYDLRITQNSDNTTLLDTNIAGWVFEGTGNKLIVKKTGLGQIKFLDPVIGQGENLSYDIQIRNNFAFIDSTKTGLDKPAEITFYNLSTSLVNPRIYKGDTPCTDCYNLTSLNAGTVIFNVTSWSNYSIQSDPYCGDGVCFTGGTCPAILEKDCRYTEGASCSSAGCTWLGGPDCYEPAICAGVSDEATCNSHYFCEYYLVSGFTCRSCTWALGMCTPVGGASCDIGTNEDTSTCPADCGSPPVTPPSGGGGSCSDTCISKGYDCGTQSICGSQQNCGTCSNGEICSSGKCISNCTENWQCSPWSSCTNALKTRTCTDINNCITALNKPTESEVCEEIEEPKEIEENKGVTEDISNIGTRNCDSSLVCSNWSYCEVKPEFQDVISGVQEIKGKQYRDCIDKKACVLPKQEYRECIIKIDVYSNVTNIEGDSYIEVYNKETKELISRIKDKKKSETPSLDISFLTGNSINNINSEEEIEQTTQEISLSPEEKSYFEKNINLIVNLGITFLILLLLLIILLLNGYSDIDQLIKIGEEHIKNKEFNKARSIYNSLKELYNTKYQKNKEVYERINEFYSKII